MADDLRAALVEAKLAGTKAEDGAHAYLFRSNEAAAIVALDEFARWLFEQANSVMGYSLTLPVDGREREDEMYTAKRLRDFAAHVQTLVVAAPRPWRPVDALTQPSTEETR